jgi:hypothetical protein
MNNNFNNIQWVIQKNLTNRSDVQNLKSSFEKLEIAYQEIDVIPFSPVLPDFDKERKTIFYGSLTLGNLVMQDKSLSQGLFMDYSAFSMENYFSKWGAHMLNYGAVVTSFHDLMKMDFDKETLLFIRPDDDSKSFAGEVKEFGEISSWYDKLKMFDNTNLSPTSRIVVSKPYNIKYEWRLWIVYKKVVAASRYRENFHLSKQRGCPVEVTMFAEERCLEYTPADVFVMDVCLCGNEYFIVECGCLNAAGFYDADIEAIVFSVSAYFAEMQKV